jgi:hypothetical protein
MSSIVTAFGSYGLYEAEIAAALKTHGQRLE